VCHVWDSGCIITDHYLRLVVVQPLIDFNFPEDARWNAERQAVEFGGEIGEYRGVVRVPRRVFQRLMPEWPTPERCVEAYYLQRTRFESIAERKLCGRQLTEERNLEVSDPTCGRGWEPPIPASWKPVPSTPISGIHCVLLDCLYGTLATAGGTEHTAQVSGARFVNPASHFAGHRPMRTRYRQSASYPNEKTAARSSPSAVRLLSDHSRTAGGRRAPSARGYHWPEPPCSGPPIQTLDRRCDILRIPAPVSSHKPLN
jgi:hypothetical protein